MDGADGTSWQVVKGKPGAPKKGKQQPTAGSKADGIFAATVKTESAFSAFVREEEALEARRQAQKREKVDLPKKEEREIRPVRKATNVEEALAYLDIEEVERTYKQTSLMCPDRPAVWMNDIAAQLGTKLNGFPCDPKDVLLLKKHVDFPLSCLNESVAQLLEKIVSLNEEQSERFFETATNLLTQSRGGSPYWEYRLFVQLILRRWPQIALRRLDKIVEVLRKSTPNATETTAEVVTIWCVQQSLRSGGRIPLRDALQLVHSVLLNVHAIHVNKQVSFAGLNVADGWLLDFMADRQVNSPVFSPADYFTVFDSLFLPPGISDSSKLFSQSDKLREKAERFFARFEQLTILKEKKLVVYFTEYLKRLRPDAAAPLVCSNLLRCLVNDKDCLREWRRVFGSNVGQSCVLLNYLRMHDANDGRREQDQAGEWSVLRMFNRKELFGLLNSMRIEAHSQLAEVQRRVSKKQKEKPKAATKRNLERVDEEDAAIVTLQRAADLISSAMASAASSSRNNGGRNGTDALSRKVTCMYLLVLVVMFVLCDYLYARFVLKSRSPQSDMVSLRLANSFWSSRAVQTVVADAKSIFIRAEAECRKYEAIDRYFNLIAIYAAKTRVAIVAYSNIAWQYAEPYLQKLLSYDYAALVDSLVLRFLELVGATRRAIIAAVDYAQARWATYTSS